MYYQVKLAVHYGTCAIKFWLVPGFFPKKIMKINLKSTLYFDFCLVSKLFDLDQIFETLLLWLCDLIAPQFRFNE